jgi:hypothetical protein
MIITDLTQFAAQRYKPQSQWLRLYGEVVINLRDKRVQVRCDDPTCTTPDGTIWFAWLHNVFDQPVHTCRSCRIKGDKHPRGSQGKSPWNKGLTKATNAVMAEQGKRHSLAMQGPNHPNYGKRGSDHPAWGNHANAGTNNPQYKDGKGYERWSQRHDLPARQWAKAVKDRDRFTCRPCGAMDRRLVSHHLYDYATHPELRYVLDNGLCLCRDCHDAFHTWNGSRVKPCTAEAYEQWLQIYTALSA